MDDCELYFQNDAARMNEDLEQYQFFQHNQYSVDLLPEVLSSDNSLGVPLPQTPPQIGSEESSQSYPTIIDSLDLSGIGIVSQSSDPTFSRNNGVVLSSKQPPKYKLIQKPKQRTNEKQKPDQYPTKNFLQNFKGAHIDYLKKFFTSEYLQKFEIIQQMKGKNSMSRRLYEDLYKISEFEPIFTKMFASRYLYRAMMLSRSQTTAKKNHNRKILVLEEAFYSKRFKRIN